MQIINKIIHINEFNLFIYLFFEKIRNNSISYFHFDQKNQHSKWYHKFLCKTTLSIFHK